jgi:hypothetical protein
MSYEEEDTWKEAAIGMCRSLMSFCLPAPLVAPYFLFLLYFIFIFYFYFGTGKCRSLMSFRLLRSLGRL